MNSQAAGTAPPFWTFIGLSAASWHKTAKVLRWFKVPSNLLSVVAIIAVVAVPYVEKLVKSEETLQSRIDILLNATNSVVGMNKERESAFNTVNYSVLVARRQNELARANAVAHSIKKDVYPAVLLALSNALCETGNMSDAEQYLDELKSRGHGLRLFADEISPEELSEVYVSDAYCHAYQALQNPSQGPAEHAVADASMQKGIDALQVGTNSQQRQGQTVVVFAEWSQMDIMLGDSQRATERHQKAAALLETMSRPDPTLRGILQESLPSISAGPVAPPIFDLASTAYPTAPNQNSYLIKYPDALHEIAILVISPFDKRNLDPASLYRYRDGLLQEADDVEFDTTNGSGALVRLAFHRVIPTESPKHHVEIVWNLSQVSIDSFAGVETVVGHGTRKFTATLLPPH